MKVVLDTNILISALGWLGNPHILVKKILDKQIELAISLELIEEFRETAREKKFGFSEEEISDFIDAIAENAEFVVSSEKVDIVKKDPDDNIVLECAIEAKADFIITGDRHLLEIKEFNRIRIITVKEFLDLK